MMKKNWKQKELFDFLKANPLNVKVHIGSLSDMNNNDYIFYDRLNDIGVYSNNKGAYLNRIQFTIATKDYDDRDTLVDYLHTMLNVDFDYTTTDGREYFVAQGTSVLFMGDKK